MTISRRDVVIGTAAATVAAALPSALGVEDPAVERMRMLFGQLIVLLRSHGYATAKLSDGGSILAWLDDRNDITSMRFVSLEDDATLDVIAVLDRTASIEPTPH